MTEKSTNEKFKHIIIEEGYFTSRLTKEKLCSFYIVSSNGSIIRCIGSGVNYDGLRSLRLLDRNADIDKKKVQFIIRVLEETIQAIKKRYGIED